MATILSVEHVSKSFGGVQAVSNVSFSVDQGRITSLIGPNGSGKTTLLNMISGLTSSDAGSVSFCERQILGAPLHKVSKAGMGRTFQIVRLFQTLTSLENVMAGMHTWTKAGLVSCLCHLPRASREESVMGKEALELLGKVGLEKEAGTLAGNLPHGHQRYLELARALAGKPKLLLLDEPGGGLNPREKTELGKMLNKVKDSGIPILLVEHDMSMVMSLSEHVVVLSYGRKIAEGSPESVTSNPEVIEAYLGRGFAHA